MGAGPEDSPIKGKGGRKRKIIANEGTGGKKCPDFPKKGRRKRKMGPNGKRLAV